MFWFNKRNPNALFLDKRRVVHRFPGNRIVEVDPDLVATFTALPFPDERFQIVVFDPPHLVRCGPASWMGKKYGKLEKGWETEIEQGFRECFRVLKAGGTLIFKWNETQIPVSRILRLTPERPLMGQRCGKQAGTHWIVFMKANPRAGEAT